MSSSRQVPKKIVALDWDSRHLRVVHARVRRREVQIDRLLAARIPPDVDPQDAQQLGAHIRKVLDQEHLTTRYAVVDVPRDQAVLNTLRLPTVAPDELPGMVQIQIAKELSFPMDEAVVDYTLGAPSGEGIPTTDVLVAAVRKEVVQQYESVCAAAGLRLVRLGLRPHANQLAVCGMLRAALPERVVFIDVRPTFTEVDVLKEGRLVFSRAASVMVPEANDEPTGFTVVGAGDDDEQPAGLGLGVVQGPSVFGHGPAVNALVAEVMHSLEAYRAQDPGAAIDHLVIGGDLGVEEQLGEVLADRLSITTELYNPAGTFGWDAEEGAGAGAYAAGLGLVLSHADEQTLHYDFLHPKQMVSYAQERLRKAPLVAAVVLLFIGAAVVYGYQSTKPERDKLAELQTDIDNLRSQERDFDKFLSLVRKIEAFDRKQFVWVDVLTEVLTAPDMPTNETLVIESIDMAWADSRVVLKTRAKQGDTASQAIAALEAYRRAGSDKPVFKVSMGTQSEDPGRPYAFAQDLTVMLLKGALADWPEPGDAEQERSAKPTDMDADPGRAGPE